MEFIGFRGFRGLYTYNCLLVVPITGWRMTQSPGYYVTGDQVEAQSLTLCAAKCGSEADCRFLVALSLAFRCRV